MKCREKPRIYDFCQFDGDITNLPQRFQEKILWSHTNGPCYVRMDNEGGSQLCKAGDYILIGCFGLVRVSSEETFKLLFEVIDDES